MLRDIDILWMSSGFSFSHWCIGGGALARPRYMCTLFTNLVAPPGEYLHLFAFFISIQMGLFFSALEQFEIHGLSEVFAGWKITNFGASLLFVTFSYIFLGVLSLSALKRLAAAEIRFYS